MTYAMFGLYYLATTRMLDAGESDRALYGLATAMETTNLSESAYRRAVRDCGFGIGARIEGGNISDSNPSV